MSFLLDSSRFAELERLGGGKALNLARMTRLGLRVPEWFCISADAFAAFVRENSLEARLTPSTDLAAFAGSVERLFLECPLPAGLEAELAAELARRGLGERPVAVRSSGLDEDSAGNSFAGQFSSFLYQRGPEAIAASLKRCWASGFSERALSYRRERGLALTGIRVGVVIQDMVNAESAGVAFSRDPTKPLERERVLVSSVWGLGEGLVSGELDADHFVFDRSKGTFESHLTTKTHAFRRGAAGGIEKVELTDGARDQPSLSQSQVLEVAALTVELERALGSPQDCEWAIEGGKLFLLQTRPITSLPPDAFFDPRVNGDQATLWDNSNIIESYSGVTSPLTFSFASVAYRQVYIQFCEVMGVPPATITAHETMFRNMLGFVRGRIYYNLINWYRLIQLLPGAGSNKGFMETMMGVRQSLKPEHAKLFDFMNHPPRYSLARRLSVTLMTIYRFLRMDSIVGTFRAHFEAVYQGARKQDFRALSLVQLSELYQRLDTEVLRRWQAPIINDYLCMVFFGLLKKLTETWVSSGPETASLQNDLLCGQGDLESTEPTKTLMRIAARVDQGDAALREWVVGTPASELWKQLQAGKAPELRALILDFLDKYGFRCVNELKLEEPDLHEDPSFVVNAISSYVRMKSYSIAAMEERERAIRDKAEAVVKGRLSGLKLRLYFWVLRQARRAVRNRENLRFARTKIFGIARHLFRAMGGKLAQLGALETEADIFYLTVEEILAFVEGRPIQPELRAVVGPRKREFERYRATPPPPDRLLTYGASGASMAWPQVLAEADLLRSELPASQDPDVLIGTPCCPGVVEGVVRVVIDLKDAEGLAGEILVTGRTDPGWVPLYPSCSGLLIERGSLLSHSAVVARELGLPTIVGISGGLLTKLRTGMKVRVDAGKGEVRILR
ncbi:MAG: phosphoenolpyruvate synthase [Oligoflexia bacterium]|nr:phosphoenolpyruvate synthase [Oligoflexia bacterium]